MKVLSILIKYFFILWVSFVFKLYVLFLLSKSEKYNIYIIVSIKRYKQEGKNKDKISLPAQWTHPKPTHMWSMLGMFRYAKESCSDPSRFIIVTISLETSDTALVTECGLCHSQDEKLCSKQFFLQGYKMCLRLEMWEVFTCM